MAKREKIELTPEEIIAKKIRRSDKRTRFWAFLLAVVLTAGVFFIAKTSGEKASDIAVEQTTESSDGAESSVDFFSDGDSESSDTAAPADNNGGSSTDANAPADNNGGNSAAPADNNGGDAATPATPAATTPEAVAKLINEATANAVNSKAGYDWARQCTVKDIDVGGSTATGVINRLISSISEGDDLNSVVGGFLGNGSKQQTVPKGQTLDTIDVKKDDGTTEKLYHGSSYTLKATQLQAGDIRNLKVNGNVYEFDLPDSSNPNRSGNTALSRFCNDIVVREEIDSELKGYTSAVTVNSLEANYKNIHVRAKIVDGKLTELIYAMKADAKLVIKIGISITGTGNLTAQAKYSNFVY